MHDIEKHIDLEWKHLKANHLFIACSGGLDSTVLLFVFKKLNYNVSAIHVNYQLRGEDSEKDAEFIRQFCREQQIPFEMRIEAIQSQLEKGGNLQELARNKRYQWFEEILSSSESNRILLAHHQDDQVETFIMNLGRKSGVMGLSCMLPENKKHIRPLLHFSKTEIREYANKNAISWREDQSNKSNKYTRNKVRNDFMPFLRREIPHIDGSIMYLVDQFQKLQKQIELKTKPIVAEILTSNFLSDETFNSLDTFEQIELFRLLGQSASFVEQLNKLSLKGTKIALTPTKELLSTHIIREQEGYSFYINTTKLIPQLNQSSILKLPQTFSKDKIYLDKNKLKGELKIRKWEIGDRIKPIGMKGSQLISDILNDNKLSFTQKEETYVVHDDQEIHWCIGLKIGRTAVADKNSIQLLEITSTTPK